ncbi:MAG: biotin/lipoyl-containing protein, partial [Dehalococcoidia bacterium]
MADFALPNLGENIDEADVLKILVAEGDVIAVDQPLLEIETEKATLDVPSELAGRVTKIHVAPGDVVKPGQVLITVESGAPSAAAPAASPALPAARAAAATAPMPPPASPSEPAPVAPPSPPAAPAAIAPPAPPARVAPPAPPASTLGRQPVEPVTSTTAAPADVPVFAAPSVRHFAREVGVDLRGIVGSGPAGRITEDDVKRHAREQTSRPIIVQMSAEPAEAARERLPLPDFAQW